MSEKINPCPNPACTSERPPTLTESIESWIKCGCGLSTPMTNGRLSTIAAWNSISMGWLPAETAPKDGTPILAVLSDHGEHDPFPAVVAYTKAWRQDQGWEQVMSGGSEPWPAHYLIGWKPIPPLPEGKR